jgi:hypothetical protein
MGQVVFDIKGAFSVHPVKYDSEMNPFYVDMSNEIIRHSVYLFEYNRKTNKRAILYHKMMYFPISSVKLNIPFE